MNPFGTRRDAEALDRLLDAPAAHAPAEDARAADAAVTNAGPAEPGSPAALLPVVARLEAAAADLSASTQPRPEFRDALRTRLVAVAGLPAPAPVPERRQARTGVAARVLVGTAAVAVAAGGITVSAQRALPGDVFYGLKRAGEQVTVRTADGPLDLGLVHLHHASARLDELARLTRERHAALGPVPHGGGPAAGAASDARVRRLLTDMDRDTATGNGLVLHAVEQDRATAPLAVLSAWAVAQGSTLAGLVPALPLSAQPRAQASLRLVAGVEKGATVRLAGGGPGASPAPTPSPTPS